MSLLGSFGRAAAMVDRAYRLYGLRGVVSIVYAHVPGWLSTTKIRRLNLGFGSMFLRPDSTDLNILKDVFMGRAYDLKQFEQYPRVKAFYTETLSRGLEPLIIDCGAYNGFSSRFFAQEFPLAKIIAIEPSMRNFELLQRNVCAFKRITARRAAISCTTSAVKIQNPEGALCGYITTACSPEDPDAIESIGLGDLFATCGNAAPFIIKIDIEGAEGDAFYDDAWFSRTAIVIIELHDWMLPWKGSSAALIKTLGSNDVDVVISGENLIVFNWSMLNPSSKSHTSFGEKVTA